MKLKICGVKTVEEAEGLKATNVEYIGLNFVPTSSRCISLETAQEILAVLRNSTIQSIALFQNQPLDMVEEYVRQLNVDYVQLHGDEPAEYARSLQAPVMRAIAVDPTMSANELINFIKNYPADYFVLDRTKQGQGDIVDIGLAKQIMAALPDRICLAGGLNPDNLTSILTKVQPYAIDISSGVRTGDSIDMAKVNDCLKIISAGRSSRP
jgi:phosphoribosylanthranilate isomerase